MSESVVSVTGGGELRTGQTPPVFSAPVRILAQVVSYVFHPVFVMMMMVAYLVFWNQDLYVGASSHEKLGVLIRVAYTNVFIPLLVVLLSKALKFIESIQLKTQRDRIIPYVATLSCYFWTYLVARNLDDPHELKAVLFGGFLAVSGALVLNSFLKISMHAIGVGGMFMMAVLMLFRGNSDMALPLIVATFIAGLVCTARMIVSDHTNRELTLGFALGMAAQVIAFLIMARA